MMQHAHAGHLALPLLTPSIPFEVYIPGESELATPLAIALLEAGLVTDAMLNPGPHDPSIKVLGEPDERELVMLGLSTWWDRIRATHCSSSLYWDLHIQQLNNLYDCFDDGELQTGTGWFCLTRRHKTNMPRFALANRIMALELVLEGFGQTVLAVLKDAMRLLPDALEPWRAEYWAETLHWSESCDDDEFIKDRMEDGKYATVEECLANENPMTRARFYFDMPRWVFYPRRVVSRDDIVRAATGPWEKNVIAACDAVLATVSAPEFALNSFDVGSHSTRVESIDGWVVLLWREGDAIGAVLDEATNMCAQSGEYTEFIDAQAVPPTAEAILAYMRRTEQILELALPVENLLNLIGEPL